uniref:Uncharacterized protein n=1 Tax=Rhizophora mucronata TaxID=61149 RepID=A0A2P2JFW9_RHIMU
MKLKMGAIILVPSSLPYGTFGLQLLVIDSTAAAIIFGPIYLYFSFFFLSFALHFLRMICLLHTLLLLRICA